ncbi:MAG: FAA hydrolase family protein [Deltaproteobacteria bacterium]|nr:MAG: FAA hydrolase family protein [Deltaproteobacteria bacterium]
MKLATIKRNGSRDGSLIIVSSDNARFITASDIAPTLQYALDHWAGVEAQLRQRSEELNAGEIADARALDEDALLSPLPRAYEWIDGSAYINHIVLVRKARGAEPPATLETDPLVYQGGSGRFLAPTQDIVHQSEEYGIDFEAEIAVVVDDVPRGTRAEDAEQYIRLVMLVNDVTLRNLIPPELAKGFGFFVSKPATAFSPLALTLDELGDWWRDGRVHLPLRTVYNDSLFGDPEAGPEMHFSFLDLIEHAARTRDLTAGTIIGSGTVSNVDRSRGSSCLAEKRMLEKIDTGSFSTPFMQFGDRVVIEMLTPDGRSLFGAIRQTVRQG